MVGIPPSRHVISKSSAAVLHEWHFQDLSAVDGGNGPAVAHVELRRLSSRRMKPEKPRDLWMIQGDSVVDYIP